MLTNEQKENYIKKGAANCPYCNSQNLKADQFNFDGSGVWQSITCNDCGKSWRDVYELNTIEDD